MTGEGRIVNGVAEERLVRWIIGLAPRYHWTGWQGLDHIESGIECRALVGTYEQAIQTPDTTVILEHQTGAPIAGTILTPKPMETEHFGIGTASLAHVVAEPELDDRGAIVEHLLKRAKGEARRRGVELLILRVVADDVGTLAAAQRSGFRVVEGTLNFLADSPAGRPPMPENEDILVEVFEGDVRDALTDAEVEALTTATSGWKLSRFRADPLLPREVVDQYYSAWVPNMVSGRWSDCLFVARRGSDLVGIYSEVTDQNLLSLTGLALRVTSWMVVLREGQGVGQALMAANCHHRFPGGRFHEVETQMQNYPVVRCIERTGVARLTRSSYTLHAWPQRD